MPASRQQKFVLAFAAIACLLLGGGIAACGFLFDYLEPYDVETVNGQSYEEYEYYYVQYWLGVPLFVLGILLLLFLCFQSKPLLIICIILSTLTLALSIAAVVLEGPKWRSWISIRRYVVHNDEKERIDGTCLVINNAFLGSQLRPLSCREIFYATLMQSIVVACSIFGIVVSQFTAFVSIRVLGWMSGGSYDMERPKMNSKHDFSFNMGSSNAVIFSEM